MDGNVTEDGARRDLEWMGRVGIGGVQNFNVSFEGLGADFDVPRRVNASLTYMTAEWGRALRSSVVLARKLCLEFSIASAAGWSESGAPWVKPQQAMKKLVWSETWVRGGSAFRGRLAKPPETTGPFQSSPLEELGVLAGVKEGPPMYYADVATLAYRAPASEVPFASLRATVTSSAGTVDLAPLSDGDLATTASLPFGDGENAWIQFSFPKRQQIQAVTAAVGPRPIGANPLQEMREVGWLEASDDGQSFFRVADLPRSGAPQQTISFQPVAARIFRLVFERPEPGLAEQMGLAAPQVAHQLAALVLHSGARVNRFEDKAGYSTRQILDEDDTPPVASGDSVPRDSVVDLTRRMRADGSLDWTPPKGRWLVLRFGYSLTGRTNHPAPRTGRGLEVDKLNRKYVKSYIDTYLGEYEAALGPDLLGPQGVQYMITDSYEAGAQNWTDDMLEQFRHRRGYDAKPWLPVLAGRVVESAAASDRFLWDFRKTLGELMTDAYYSQLSESLHQHGLGQYAESHEFGRAFIGDGMEAKKTADIPTGAMWATDSSLKNYEADIRESASVAHIYGKNVVAAESFTMIGNPYVFPPEVLKQFADRELAMGVNRFIIHTSVHQPDSKPGPGIGLGPFGQWFTRKETWAEQASGWVNYLTRSSYLLQQGRFVADIAYLYGEDANITSLFHTRTAAVPPGYSFDFVNPDALINELSVKDGNLQARSGMEYRVLVLDASTHRLSLPVLRKIRDLVQAGALVVGAKPASTPSLADDEREFHAIVAELWSDTAGVQVPRTGQSVLDRSLPEVLTAMNISPDVTFAKSSEAKFRFVHRALQNGEIYFVSNDTEEVQRVQASFRISGRRPELWNAEAGTIVPLTYWTEDGRTLVPLKFGPRDAAFVVFRQPTVAGSASVAESSTELLGTLQGPWEVTFPPDIGAPEHVYFTNLDSWTESADVGVKYFSGTAVYNKTTSIPASWLRNHARLQLDLGQVKSVAEVLINGRSMGVVWRPPFKFDITDGVRKGQNRFQIRVTNLWANRLIGDLQPGAHRIASATFDPFKAKSPLVASGLLGPVTFLSASAN